METCTGQVPAEVKVHHTGFHPGRPPLDIYVQNPVHPRRHDDHRVVARHRTPCKAGTRPPGHEGPSVPTCRMNTGRHFSGALRKADDSGPTTLEDRAIRAVEVPGHRPSLDPSGVQRLHQLVNQGVSTRSRRKAHRHSLPDLGR